MGMILFSVQSYADLSPLSATELRAATGQAGIAVTVEDKIAIDIEKGQVAYCDEDGTDGTPGYLSANGISFHGSVSSNNPITVEVTTEPSLYTGKVATGMNIAMNDVQMDINEWSIDSITVGSELGSGNSFGGFSFTGNHHISISGNLRITAH